MKQGFNNFGSGDPMIYTEFKQQVVSMDTPVWPAGKDKEIVEVGNKALKPLPPTPPTELNYFYIENLSDQSNTITIQKSDESAPTIQITCESWDGGIATGFTSTSGLNFTIAPHERIYLFANTNTWCDSGENNYIFGSDSFSVGGNIMSLLYGNNYKGKKILNSKGTFMWLFGDSSYLVDASELILPATTLTEDCYNSMFDGCTSLTAAPELPATTLANYCYNSMFSGCTSLTAAPELPATTLTEDCYASMFSGCTSLTAAPELPATTLTKNCYAYMFDMCTSLSEVTSYAQSVNTTDLYNWLYKVADAGTFYNLGGATYEQDSASGIPTGWTIETEKPTE